MEDDSLYSVIFWTLTIGTIVVLATLYFTNPPAESFSEIFFLNHESLPEYVDNHTRYNYTFAITNHENKNMQYNYTISAELYNIDYSCEKPELWLDKNTDKYSAESKDITLYIKEKRYAISTAYELRSGKKFKLKLVDINGNEKYSVSIDHEQGIAELLGKNLSIPITAYHTLLLDVNETNITLQIDNRNLTVPTPKDYTQVFPALESELIDFTGFGIQRGKIRQSVSVKYADAKYEQINLERKLDENILSPYHFPIDSLYNRIITGPISIVQYRNTTSEYNAKIPINFTSFTLRSKMRLNKDSNVIIGLSDILTIDLKEQAVINGIPYPYVRAASNDLIIIYNGSTARIIMNENHLTSVNVSLNNTVPNIKTINAKGVSLSVKSLTEPISVTYNFPDLKQTAFAGIYRPSTLDSLRLNETPPLETTQTINEIFKREKSEWDDYTIKATYMPDTKDSVFVISYESEEQSIYTLSLNNTDNTFVLSYLENNSYQRYKGNITPETIKQIVIDVNNNNFRLQTNSQTVFSKKLQNTTGGIVLFDYPGITLIGAQMEDKNSNAVRVYKKETPVGCRLIQKKELTYNNTRSIVENGITKFSGYVEFYDYFDIAKVQVSLDNGQEIHFWTKVIE